MSILNKEFYERSDILLISQELLGKLLFTNFKNKLTVGMIVETEAYAGVTDRASHAYGNKNTNRTKIMYESGGIAYVYLCYGIHHLFNIVTNKIDIPHAILIRAIEPMDGIKTMLKRRNKKTTDHTLTSGPGSLSKAMGITLKNSGESLISNHIWLEDQNITMYTCFAGNGYADGDPWQLSDWNGALNGGHYNVIYIEMSASW